MGRKKRKVANVGTDSDTVGAGMSHSDVIPPPPPPPPPPPVDPRRNRNGVVPPPETPEESLFAVKRADGSTSEQVSTHNNSSDSPKKMSSGYATTSHSAEIIDEDIYVSDGSESDEDLMVDRLDLTMPGQTPQDAAEGNNADETGPNKTNISGRSIEMVLSGSKMGLMRRGIHRPQVLVQPNRQWARQAPTAPQDAQTDKEAEDGAAADDSDDPATAEERRKRQQEEELAKLDPAQRAARLLAEKQRKLEEAKILARKLESEENAGRDPCLFSKRTSFDIRFDQIDDKPWLRGAGDVTDFFNYGFSEEDWLEYAEQQVLIRQELIDASRQKRAPDPSIVPVVPKKPKRQNPRVAVASGSTDGKEEDKSGDGMDVDGDGNKDDNENSPSVIGPFKKEVTKDAKAETASTMQGPTKNEGPSSSNDLPDIQIGVGGAWGMGAAPGSVLAKLIEEQEKQQQRSNAPMHDPSQSSDQSPRKGRGTEYHGGGGEYNKYDNNPGHSYYGNSGGGDSSADYNDAQADSHNDHPSGGWNRHHNSQQQSDDNRRHGGEGNRNYRYQNHGGHHNNDRNNNNSGGSPSNGEWNSRNDDRGGRHQGWNAGGRGGHRGGNRGGGGRRGGGDYSDGNGRNRGGGNYGDKGGYHRRKRPRDDYDDRYSRR